ncbi:MAG: hypothetical protein FJ102_12155 [Deltaproteobacteria bacterium]|nr:hypothetical protein [Deltaproteobacteria bacterium]
MLRLVRRVAPLTDEEEDILRTAVQELITNTCDHSASECGGVLAARVIPSLSEVRTLIVDTGVGVRRSLEGRHPGLSDRQAVRCCATA